MRQQCELRRGNAQRKHLVISSSRAPLDALCAASLQNFEFLSTLLTDPVGMIFMFKTLLPKNLAVGGGFLLIFLLLFWLRSRKYSDRLPMKSLGLNLLVYGFLFVIGEGYLVVFFADMKWSRVALYLAMLSWGVLLIPGPWSRRMRPRQEPTVARK